MKKGVVFVCIVLWSGAVLAQSGDNVIRLSEPVYETEGYEIFGTDVNQNLFESAVTLSELIKSGQTEGEITLVTTIAQVCRKKGMFLHRSR